MYYINMYIKFYYLYQTTFTDIDEIVIPIARSQILLIFPCS